MRRCKAHPDRHALEGVCAGLFRNQLPWFSFDVCFSFALFSATDGFSIFSFNSHDLLTYLLLTTQSASQGVRVVLAERIAERKRREDTR